MKKQIAAAKKFYSNNEKTILVGVGVVLGSFTTSLAASSALKGMTLADANLYSIAETGQQFLRVQLQNGTTTDYLWQSVTQ